jgi:non-lysosomal glucosylceramidase
MRSYALGDEPGLSVTAYPDPSKRPEVPLSYFAEAWSGLEYTAATGMIYEGMDDKAIRTISDVRKRYDGFKRNPFNEEECGNHYARAMASWSAIVALSGFNYNGVEGSFMITSKPGKYFWSNGHSWGNAIVSENAGKTKVKINVNYGKLKLSSVSVKGSSQKIKKPVILTEGSSQEFVLSH